MALEMRAVCEKCQAGLDPGDLAFICSYECTFCRDCVDSRLGGICPNCGGKLVARPIRPAVKLQKDPGSTVRVFKPAGCGQAASA